VNTNTTCDFFHAHKIGYSIGKTQNSASLDPMESYQLTAVIHTVLLKSTI